MGEITISLQNVSKCFKRYRHPADRLKEILLPGKSRADEFWALRELNLEIRKGQTLGVVGRNGSGKSTLLQIIAGTLTPTTGDVHVQGRISALLELGSGFNPEFTGRQNVFFNGQLLGLKQQEIADRFDDIAAFADIGDFIEEPVKTYSSGMFVRLAFAVATSVEPDILVVDEALSVGDEAFQRKCFARIEKIQERGGTVLFVSHAASSVIELCDSAILMDRGELLLTHHPKFVVDKYQKLIYAPADKIESVREEIRAANKPVSVDTLNQNAYRSEKGTGLHAINGNLSVPEIALTPFYDPGMKPGNTTSYLSQGAEITAPHITTLKGQKVNHLISRDDYIYSFAVDFYENASHVRFGMLVKTISGLELGGASYALPEQTLSYVEAGSRVVVKFRFKCILNPGVYFLNAGVSGIVNGHFTYLARCIDVAMFRVHSIDSSYGTGTIDFLIKPSVTVENQLRTIKKEVELI